MIQQAHTLSKAYEGLKEAWAERASEFLIHIMMYYDVSYNWHYFFSSNYLSYIWECCNAPHSHHYITLVWRKAQTISHMHWIPKTLLEVWLSTRLVLPLLLRIWATYMHLMQLMLGYEFVCLVFRFITILAPIVWCLPFRCDNSCSDYYLTAAWFSTNRLSHFCQSWRIVAIALELIWAAAVLTHLPLSRDVQSSAPGNIFTTHPWWELSHREGLNHWTHPLKKIFIFSGYFGIKLWIQ